MELWSQSLSHCKVGCTLFLDQISSVAEPPRSGRPKVMSKRDDYHVRISSAAAYIHGTAVTSPGPNTPIPEGTRMQSCRAVILPTWFWPSPLPQQHHKTSGHRSFFCPAPSVWNCEVRHGPSSTAYENSLKTHLFKTYYY